MVAKKRKFTDQHLQIAAIAKAMGHPARVYILEKLISLNACCTSGEMIGEIPIARSTLSQHLKALKYAGLIQGNIEPPKIKYCINQENWVLAQKLLSDFFKTNSDTTKSC